MHEVSVVLPTYNRAHLLPRALESVFAQGIAEIEIIVVDDGSTDGTREAVVPWRERIVYIAQENAGPAAARNRGIRQARGEYMAFLDSDDVWTAGSLGRRLQALALDPALVMAFGNFRNMPDRADGPWPTMFEKCRRFRVNAHPRIGKGIYRVDNFAASSLLEPIACTSGVVVRRAVAGDALRFDPDLRIGEDWDLWTRLGLRGPVAVLDDVTFHRYLQSDNVTLDRVAESAAEIVMYCNYLQAGWLQPRQRALVRRRLARAHSDLAYAIRRGAPIAQSPRTLYLRSLCTLPTMSAARGLLGLALDRLVDRRP